MKKEEISQMSYDLMEDRDIEFHRMMINHSRSQDGLLRRIINFLEEDSGDSLKKVDDQK